jgi:repressor LexA
MEGKMIYLKWLRSKEGIKQSELAKKLNVSRTTISMWENESSLPGYDTLESLSKIFGEPVSLIVQPITEWDDETQKAYNLISNDGERIAFLEENGIPHDLAKFYHMEKNRLNIKKKTRIPVLGYVRGGNPETAFEEVIGYEEITEEMMHSGDYFGLIVKGDSMEPRFTEGDTVIVKKQPSADSGNIIVAMIGDTDATIKKIIIDDKGMILQPLNPAYKPRYFSKDDIRTLPVTVLGKVVELRAKF